MMKKLMHIAMIVLISAIGMVQIADNHPIYGNHELSFSSCENDEHGHSDFRGVHICFLLRRNHINEYLIPEQFVNEYNSLNQKLFAEDVLFSQNSLAALFIERSPPA